MRAMVLEKVNGPLVLKEIPAPEPASDQILIKVGACGICRTDLHIKDGELTKAKLPLILGHQIVGTLVGKSDDRIGVPWLGGTCGQCEYCLNGKENLCDHALFTGYQIDGGFAEYCVANPNFCFPIPSHYSDIQVAPLLCGGLIGYRAYRMLENAKRIGFYGFGSAAHIITQIAVYQNKEIYAFTKPGDLEAQKLATHLGAVWTGGSDEVPPHLLEGVIIFAPVGPLIPTALEILKKAGKVICAGIHMSDVPSFPYKLLWGERSLSSVANLTRKDAEDFLKIAAEVPIKTHVSVYPLEQTNQALDDLKSGNLTGSAVIVI